MHVFYDKARGDYRVRGIIERGIEYTLTIETGKYDGWEKTRKIKSLSTTTYTFNKRNIRTMSGVNKFVRECLRGSNNLKYHRERIMMAFMQQNLLSQVNAKKPITSLDLLE